MFINLGLKYSCELSSAVLPSPASAPCSVGYWINHLYIWHSSSISATSTNRFLCKKLLQKACLVAKHTHAHIHLRHSSCCSSGLPSASAQSSCTHNIYTARHTGVAVATYPHELCVSLKEGVQQGSRRATSGCPIEHKEDHYLDRVTRQPAVRAKDAALVAAPHLVAA